MVKLVYLTLSIALSMQTFGMELVGIPRLCHNEHGPCQDRWFLIWSLDMVSRRRVSISNVCSIFKHEVFKRKVLLFRELSIRPTVCRYLLHISPNSQCFLMFASFSVKPNPAVQAGDDILRNCTLLHERTRVLGMSTFGRETPDPQRIRQQSCA
jgi:hypothetical protein